MPLTRRYVVGLAVGLAALMLFAIPALAVPPAPPDQAVATMPSTPVIITLTATDPLAGGLTFQTANGPSNGVLGSTSGPMSCDGTSCTVDVTYTPNLAFEGPDSFEFTVTDTEPSTSE